jgi:hypothetical protein
MNSAIDQFRINIARTRELSYTVNTINQITTSVVDLSDFLRAEIVLAVSSLDFFIHEYVRIEMLQICRGNRTGTDTYYKFPIPLKSVHLVKDTVSDEQWLDEVVRDKHSWLSFQEPDKIADAIRLISTVKLWDEVAREVGKTTADVKAYMKVIADRRNKIAHEADMDQINPGLRWPIDEKTVKEVVDFIEKVVEAIYKVTK